MSKLLEKLERMSEGRARPLGFEAALTRAQISPMLLIAGLPAGKTNIVSTATGEGADALLFNADQRKKEKNSPGLINDTQLDIPWGVSLPEATGKEIGQLMEMKCDFVVFTPETTPASVLGKEGIGKVLQIDSSLGDSLIKTITRLQLDAVLLSPLEDAEYPLTIRQLMLYEQLAGGVGKHLLAAMPPGMPAEDLESLWGIGVRGVVVDLTVEHPGQRLSEVKEAIQKLPMTRKKSKGSISAIVPFARVESTPVPPEEDDDDI